MLQLNIIRVLSAQLISEVTRDSKESTSLFDSAIVYVHLTGIVSEKVEARLTLAAVFEWCCA